MSLDEALAGVETHSPEPLRARIGQARQRWQQPPRVVLLGRIGAGKSALINSWAPSARRPVGLGGITEAASVVELEGLQLVDTPGIDATGRAIAQLEPLCAQADALLWVVDGLQPATRSERRVLRAVRPEGMPLYVRISRLDLVDAAERDAVIGRVRSVAPAPADLRAINARAAEVGPLPSPPPGPGRYCEVEGALDAADAWLARSPARLEVDVLHAELRFHWRDLVRGVRWELWSGGGSWGRRELRQRLVRLGRERVGAWRLWLQEHPEARLLATRRPPPDWPLPAAPSPRGLVGLALPPVRSAEEVSLAWLVEGEARVARWTHGLVAPGREEWEQLDAAVAQARRVLDELRRTPYAWISPR